MYNKVTLIGRLGKDVEVRFTQSQMKIAKFTLATSRYWTDNQGNRQEKTEWHNVAMFGKNAENAERLLSKGSLVMVEGEIRYNEWTDNQGVKKFFTEIAGNQFLILSPKRDNSGGGNYQQQGGYQSQGYQQKNRQNDASFVDEIPVPDNDFDDDVPF